MKHRKLGVFIAAVVACVTVPATAGAQTAACGTTPEQWVGYFPGTMFGEPFDHVITLANGVLDVEELNPPANQSPEYGTPAVNGNSLTWAYADGRPGGPGFSTVNTTESVTCANGVVQSFTGDSHWVYGGVGGGTLLEAHTPFSSARA